MSPKQKHYLKLFGIQILKIKAINAYNFDIYLFFLPFLSIRTNGKKTNINFLIVQKIYTSIKKHLKNFLEKRKNKKNRQKIIQKFRNGELLKICLITSRPGMWSYDYLYKLLKNDNRFEVVIVVMPDPFQGKDVMFRYLHESTLELEKKGIASICGWNYENNIPLNFKEDINPDLILYSDFWYPHFNYNFYILNNLDKITMLNEYGYSVMQDEKTCGFEMNRLVDMYFRPTEIHKKMAEKIMKNNGKNVIVTGSPKLDYFLDTKYKPQSPWKKQNKTKKRIIWAPHHSRYMPNDMYCCNAFWEIYDFMLEIAKKYKDEIQFAFRPHPMLREKILKEWGEDATCSYFKKWESLDNCQISDGNFIDLFMTSDAMIMDCCSFLAEYTATNKPLFYTRTKTSRLILNEFGKKLFENVYDTKENLVSDIDNFIQKVVIEGDDYKKEERTKFVKQYFGKINKKTASENIYDAIINFLEKGEI